MCNAVAATAFVTEYTLNNVSASTLRPVAGIGQAAPRIDHEFFTQIRSDLQADLSTLAYRRIDRSLNLRVGVRTNLAVWYSWYLSDSCVGHRCGRIDKPSIAMPYPSSSSIRRLMGCVRAMRV